MYLALRDLLVARGRFALVGAVIALVSLLAGLLSGLATGLVDDGISGLRRLPLTHVAFQEGSGSEFSRSSLGPDQLAPWQDRLGDDAAPVGLSFFNARTPDGALAGAATFSLFDKVVLQGTFLGWLLRSPDRVPGMFPVSSKWRLVLFGLGAIQYAAHPEGILETTRAKRNRRRAEQDDPAELVVEANA